jgi:hypothetical protein
MEHAITDTEIPTGGGNDVKGNILTFNNPVFNVVDTKQVGHDEGLHPTRPEARHLGVPLVSGVSGQQS